MRIRGTRCAQICTELVEDLELVRFSVPADTDYDWWLIDRRRLKRELKRLPAMKAEAKKRFDSDLRGLHDRQRQCILLDDVYDGASDSPELRRRLLEWFDATFGDRTGIHVAGPFHENSASR